jgi:hypothetical protein
LVYQIPWTTSRLGGGIQNENLRKSMEKMVMLVKQERKLEKKS